MFQTELSYLIELVQEYSFYEEIIIGKVETEINRRNNVRKNVAEELEVLLSEYQGIKQDLRQIREGIEDLKKGNPNAAVMNAKPNSLFFLTAFLSIIAICLVFVSLRFLFE